MDKQSFESTFNIETSADKQVAFISIKILNDNTSFNVDEVSDYLRSKGIVHGLLHDNIRLLCSNPIAYLAQKIDIARGEPSKKGKDGFVRLINKVQAKDSSLTADESETVDFKQVTKLNNVIKGQLIAELVPPQPGKAGVNIFGESTTPILGKPARIKVGKNVVLNGEGAALYAAIDGLISITDNDKINVFPVFEVNGDVDYSIGNIDFVGTVVIRGNVLTGFKVKASGDIRVIGGVEGAELISDGSIEVTGGVMASGKGKIEAQNNIKCSFIQDANIYAGGDIIVSQSIMHSTVRAGRTVQCMGAKGLIVGGVIQASENVTARTIGNPMSTNTIIEVGVNPALREEQVQLRASLKENKENLDRTDKALVILDQMAASGKLTPDRLAMRQKLIQSKRLTTVLVDEAKQRMFEIEKMLENSDKSSVNVKNTVYGGVKIVIGRYTKYIKDSTNSIVFRYSEGDIVMHPYY